jgi:hypothetical protein
MSRDDIVIEHQLRVEPWLHIGLSPRAWYDAHRKSIELPLDRIAAAVQPYDVHAGPKARSGVYFLFDAGGLLYVGRSMSIHRRLSMHARYGKVPFDRVAFVELPADVAHMAEDFYIHREQPAHNVRGIH